MAKTPLFATLMDTEPELLLISYLSDAMARNLVSLLTDPVAASLHLLCWPPQHVPDEGLLVQPGEGGGQLDGGMQLAHGAHLA